jgi:putative transposase
MDEVRQWQMRPLESVYPIVYVDCLVVNVRENQRVINKALAPFAGSQSGGPERTAGHVAGPNGGSPRSGSRC